MEAEIDALRKLAPDWSLAGDQQLLDVLQHLHLRIVSRCEETSRKLEEMVTALDVTSVHLQNVNNQFMALSNTQFVESRVYDDDVEVTTETNTQTVPQLAVEPSDPGLVDSVRQLMEHHQSVLILLDTDSSSDSDAEHTDSVVYKLKDVYAHRPLPYIIGSDAWTNKWHCGLVVEDSDPDSEEARSSEREQYSDSDADSYWDHQQQSSSTVSSPPAAPPAPLAPAAPPAPPAPLAPAPPARSAADIASELARKLAAHAPVVEKVAEREPDLPSKPVVRKTYRPDQPAAATIFSDEPPPLEQVCESERDSNTEEEDDDIFAQLRTEAKQHLKQRGRSNDAIVEEKSDSAKDIAHVMPHSVDIKPKKALFDDESEPDIFVEKQRTTNTGNTTQETHQNKDIVKKPVGGISVFGTSQGAGSIGAAILKRNQRKSSSDEDDDQITNIKITPSVVEDKKPKESDIFNDLFAKPAPSSKSVNKNKTVHTKTAPKVDVQTKVVAKPKVDLFSDNLFDDIDDIFTSNVKSVAKPSDRLNFDDDQLFADVAVAKNEKSSSNNDNKKTKSIFDSDDDLFNENTQVSAAVTSKISSADSDIVKDEIMTKTSAIKKSIFDDEDSGDDLFSNYKNITDKKVEVKIQEDKVSQVRETKSIFDDSDDDDMFLDTKTTKINTPSQPALGTHTPDKDELLKPKDSISKVSDVVNVRESNVIPDISEEKVYLTVEESHKTPITPNSLKEREKTEISVTINETPEKPPNDIFEENDWDEKPIDNSAGDNMQNNNLTIKPNNALPKNSPSIFDDDDDINDFLTTKPSNEPDLVTNKSEPEKTSVTKQSDSNSKDDHAVPNNNLKSKTDSDNTNLNNNSSLATKSSMLNNLDDDDDIFISKVNTNQKTNAEDNKVTSEKPKDHLTNPVQNLDSNKNVTQDEVLFSTIQSTILNKADDFTDIFVDQPPDFEKPKEPKRSKNVNALFDDDSEDEALFFKKSDPVLDEKPKASDKSNKDQLFGLFHDEPPEIEPDFVQKSNKKIEDSHKSNAESNTIDADTSTKQESEVNVQDSDLDKIVPVADDIQSARVVVKSFETKQEDKKTIDRENKDSEIVQESKTVGNMIEDAEKLERNEKPPETEPKKAVGKLKPMNFNINVNALVPGSSPKKMQKSIEPVDKTDGNVVSAKSNEELHITDNVSEEKESKLVKSVSFDGSPDNTVLDNKLSKERAKIQVKRRPSTRRARREAVRKSAIDIGDDSTDNSSSVDDIRPVDVKTETNDKFNQKPQVKEDPQVDFEQKSENEPATVQVESKLETENESTIKNSDSNTRQVTSKTVYILNDEDIFPTAKTEENIIAATSIDTKKPKSLLNSDDDDDIFRTGEVKVDTVIRPPTLGSIYADAVKTDVNKSESTEKFEESKAIPKVNTEINKIADKDKETVIPKAKLSLFGDSSDEELFGAKKKPAEIKSNKLFDSDSEDDLFTSKARAGEKLLERRKDVAKALAKGSLFDDDDEDDLFGGNKEKTTESRPPAVPGRNSSEKSTPQPTTSVFNDPLSILGDADE